MTTLTPQIVKVPFHGEQVLTVEIDGRPHIVLKPALESIGLDYWAQVRKLRERSWATTASTAVVAADGKVRDMVTCDVRTFLMLLATVEERRVGKDVAPKLVAYQAEVADVIERYWTTGGAINPRASDEQLDVVISRAKRQAEVLQVLDGLVDATWLEAKARHVAARALGEEPDGPRRLLTVGDYLEDRGMPAAVVRRVGPLFGKRLKAAYTEIHGRPPGMSRRFVDGAQRDVAAYAQSDRPLFDVVFNDLVDAGVVPDRAP